MGESVAAGELFELGDLFFESGDAFVDPVGAAAEAHGFDAGDFFFVGGGEAFLGEGDPVCVFFGENVVTGFKGVDFEANLLEEVTKVATGESGLDAHIAFTLVLAVEVGKAIGAAHGVVGFDGDEGAFGFEVPGKLANAFLFKVWDDMTAVDEVKHFLFR